MNECAFDVYIQYIYNMMFAKVYGLTDLFILFNFVYNVRKF